MYLVCEEGSERGGRKWCVGAADQILNRRDVAENLRDSDGGLNCQDEGSELITTVLWQD